MSFEYYSRSIQKMSRATTDHWQQARGPRDITQTLSTDRTHFLQGLHGTAWHLRGFPLGGGREHCCCPKVLCKVYYLAALMFSISHPWRCSRMQYNSSSVARPFMVLIRIQKFEGVVLVNASVEKSWGWLPHSSSFRHRKAALTVAPGVGLDHAQRK